jgi:transcriptional pleiotropic regulator of transition state genes
MINKLGIVRNMDDVGRIVIPKELRDAHDMGNGDAIEITSNESGILLKKYSIGCIFCGGMSGLKIFNSKKICSTCRKEIAEDV